MKHPDGKKILLKAYGTDATVDFEMLHNTDILDKYSSCIIFNFNSV